MMILKLAKRIIALVRHANSDFDAFVKRQQAISTADSRSSAQPDWENERDTWISSLENLYSDIQSFLKTYIDTGAIKCDFDTIILNEENIGIYEARRMRIHIGSQTITLTPIGTLLIGSKGRVDVEGSAGRSRIILINEKIRDVSDFIQVKVTIVGHESQQHIDQPKEKVIPIEWRWKILTSPPTMGFTELNPDSFMQMLLEVSNG